MISLLTRHWKFPSNTLQPMLIKSKYITTKYAQNNDTNIIQDEITDNMLTEINKSCHAKSNQGKCWILSSEQQLKDITSKINVNDISPSGLPTYNVITNGTSIKLRGISNEGIIDDETVDINKSKAVNNVYSTNTVRYVMEISEQRLDGGTRKYLSIIINTGYDPSYDTEIITKATSIINEYGPIPKRITGQFQNQQSRNQRYDSTLQMRMILIP